MQLRVRKRKIAPLVGRALLALLVSLAWLVMSGPALVQAETAEQRNLATIYEMYQGYKGDFPQVPDISPKQAMELMKRGKVVFVDVRPENERRVSMLPQAVSKEEFFKNRDKYRGYTVIGYCTISYRSGVFAREMRKKGLDIYNLQGGLLAWVNEGGKVYDQNGLTKRIHVYGRRWNYPPPGYESVW